MPGSVAAGRGANASLLAGIKNAVGYNPAAASGLVYRFRASSLTGLKHGDLVPSITTEVGALTMSQGTAAAMPTYLTNGLNGKPALRFDGADDIMAGSVPSTAMPLTFVFIFNLNSTATDQQLFFGGGPEILISSSQWSLYNGSMVSGGTPVRGGQIAIATYNGASGSAFYSNGISLISTTTLSNNPFTTINVGARSSGLRHMKADVYEMLVYSGPLSALDRSRIDSYVQLTYGISVSDFRSTLSDAPSLITGMTARYRADQITGVTSGNATASWPDSSGNFFDAVQALAANQPIWVSGVVNGQPVVRFNSSSSQNFTSAAPSGDLNQTIIAVVNLSSSSANSIATIRGAFAAGGLQFRLDYSRPMFVKENVTQVGVGSVVPLDTFIAVAGSYANNLGTYAFRANGSVNGSGANVVGLSATTTTIGYNKANGSEFFNGDIAEIICFNRILNPAELRLIESYIQDRYAIAVADYYIDDAVNQIGGVTARYRADKILGIADGGAIASWPDCSSNNNPAIQATAANQPTLALNVMNAQPVVRFNGTSHVLATAATTWGPNYTVFVVHKMSTYAANSGPIGNDYSTTVGASSQRVFRLAYSSATQLTGTSYYGNAATNESDSVPASTGAAAVTSLTRSATGIETTFNGYTNDQTASINTPTSTTNGQMTIGAVGGASGYLAGDIAEVIVFNRALTGAERSLVHTYVSARYGIAVSDVILNDAVSAVPGLQARFRADTITGVVDTGAVQCWGDSSGNGYNAVMPTLGNAPIMAANALNTQPVVRFNGANTQFLKSSMPSITGPSTVIVVMKYQTSAGNQTVLSGTNSSTYQLCYIPNGKYEIVKSITTVVAVTGASIPSNTYVALATTYDPAGPYVFNVNGTLSSSGSSGTSFVAAPATTIGTNGAVNSENLTGDIAEIMIWNRVLGSYELALVDGYVNARYGLAITDKITQIASEAFTTADSAAWPSQWTTTVSGSYSSLGVENGQGVLTSTDTSGYAKAYLSGAASFTNGGIFFTANYPKAIDYSFTQTYVNLSTDGSGAQFDTSSYSFVFSVSLGQFNAMNIYKYVNGTRTLNMTYINNVFNGPGFNVRCERIGTTLRFKIWALGSVEPGQWTAIGVDGSGSPLGAGKVSITQQSVSTVGGPVYIDNVSVYTIG